MACEIYEGADGTALSVHKTRRIQIMVHRTVLLASVVINASRPPGHFQRELLPQGLIRKHLHGIRHYGIEYQRPVPGIRTAFHGTCSSYPRRTVRMDTMQKDPFRGQT